MITKEQQRAIKCKHEQDNQGMTYLQFRRSVKYDYDRLMVQWCGMWLGIEKDGYMHSWGADMNEFFMMVTRTHRGLT